MKKLSDPILICCLSAGLGLLCLPARLWLMHAGVDSKNLLVSGHPGRILCWILTVGLAALLIAVLVVKPKKYGFRPGPFSCAGAAVSVICLSLTAAYAFSGASTPLDVVFGGMSVLAAVCGAGLAYFRFQGKRAWMILYLPGLLTLMLQFLYCFRLWSAESELQRYFFCLGAQVCILLTLFYRCAAECRMHKPTLYILFSNASVFFGFAAVADEGAGILYGLWAVSILLENMGIRTGGRKSHDAA